MLSLKPLEDSKCPNNERKKSNVIWSKLSYQRFHEGDKTGCLLPYPVGIYVYHHIIFSFFFYIKKGKKQTWKRNNLAARQTTRLSSICRLPHLADRPRKCGLSLRLLLSFIDMKLGSQIQKQIHFTCNESCNL